MSKHTTSDNVLLLDYVKPAETQPGKIIAKLSDFFKIVNKNENSAQSQISDSIYNKISYIYPLNEYSGFLIGLFNHLKRDRATRGIEFIVSCEKFAKILEKKFIVSRARPSHEKFNNETNNLSQCFVFKDLKKDIFTYSLVKLNGQLKSSSTHIDVYAFKTMSYMLSRLNSLSSDIKGNVDLLSDLLALCLQRPNNYFARNGQSNKDRNLNFCTSIVLKHDKYVFIPCNLEMPCFLFCGLKDESFVTFCINNIVKNNDGLSKTASDSQLTTEQYPFTFQIIEIRDGNYIKIDIGCLLKCYILQASHKIFWKYYTPENLINKLMATAESKPSELDSVLSIVKRIAFVNDDNDLTMADLIVCVANLKN